MYIITLIIADTQKAYDEKKISRQILQLNHVYTLCTIYLRAKPLFYFVFLLPSVCTKLKCKKWSFELYSTEQNVSD